MSLKLGELSNFHLQWRQSAPRKIVYAALSGGRDLVRAQNFDD